jgi:hypothetical protein
MPGDKDKEAPTEAQEPHREDHPEIAREARLQRSRLQMRQLATWRSQYEDYIRRAKAVITGV